MGNNLDSTRGKCLNEIGEGFNYERGQTWALGQYVKCQLIKWKKNKMHKLNDQKSCMYICGHTYSGQKEIVII